MAVSPVDPQLLDFAVDLTRRAGKLTLRWFNDPDLAVMRKADGTPVTEADRAAERLIRQELAASFPDDAVVGEEEGVAAGTSGRRWVIDPIDGTKAFTHGVPLYTTLLALEDDQGPAVGVIHVPALDEIVAAGRGLGCSHDGRPAQVSGQDGLEGAYLTTSAFDNWPEGMLRAARRAGCRLRTWGDGYGYALVATGRADAMVDPEASLWDLAPMPVILTEAGGTFTDLSGAPGAHLGSGVATNGRIHGNLLDRLAVEAP